MIKFRRFLQLCFLGLFFFLFIQARFPYAPTFGSDLFLRMSPLVPIFYFIAEFTLKWIFWPAFIILLLTPVLGRFFCGWICPLGSSFDIFHRLTVYFKRKKSRFNLPEVPWLKYSLLMFFIVLSFFSIHLWGYLDPISIFTRLSTTLFYPLFTFFTESSLLHLSALPAAGELLAPGYDFFKDHLMPESQATVLGISTFVCLLLIIYGSEFLSHRFWCRNICPAGALLGFFSKFRIYERLVADSCTLCNKCVNDCRMNAIPADNIPFTNKTECIECFSCATKCPPKAESIKYKFSLKPYQSSADYSRRKFLGTAVTGVALAGIGGVSLHEKNNTTALVRPPGVKIENEFLDKCIRCLECVRICESNGKCLQPADFRFSIDDLWTPVAMMRKGYCEFNCNLCGEVCPTGAIPKIEISEKQKTVMGLAYFAKDLCIPYARHEDCLVCEEHCPVPDKAIKFKIKQYTDLDGTVRKVKYPIVLRELCIGCGICETKCPLPSAPGIFIIRDLDRQKSGIINATDIYG